MASRSLKINIPSHFFIALNKTEDELKKEMRLYAAMHFYQSGKLTIGKAAEFAELSRWEFENILSDNNIPISNLDTEDIKADLKKMQNI